MSDEARLGVYLLTMVLINIEENRV